MTMKKNLIAALAALALGAGAPTGAFAADKEIRWGTSRVGSSGHRILTNLSNVLNKEWKGYQISVQPTPGAIVSVKGYATEQFDGYYGSDVGFFEFANGIRRFKGFQDAVKRAPVQSFWTFTIEVGVGIHDRDSAKITSWGQLDGQRFFTGPRPWDTRAQMERALEALGIKHDYIEVDIQAAGSLLEQGNFTAYTVYTNAESTTAGWITQAGLATDWNYLNPSAEERAKLEAAGFNPVEVPTAAFKEDVGVDKMVMLPFFYGLHVGMEVPADDLYQMLLIVEKNVDALAAADKAFIQLKEDMPKMQRRGVQAAADLVEIHPGLARYMRERNVWDAKWDSRVAK